MHQPVRHRAGPIFFLFACALYFFASADLGSQGIAYLSITSVTLAFVLGLVKGDARRFGVISPVFLAMLLVALINVAVSTDRQETALRWLIWFEMLIAFGMLASQCDDEVDKSLASLLPFATCLIWFAKYRTAQSGNVDLATREADLHLSAFFANVTIAIGFFHPRPAWRVLFCVIGIYGALVSGSRAAFIFMPLLLLTPFLYYSRSKATAIAAAMLSAALLGALFFNDTLRDATFGRKSSAAGKDVIADAQESMSDRAALRELAFDMIRDRPLGYGYGNTYTIPGSDRSRGTNFHNGYLNVGAALGAPFLALYICFNFWLAWTLFTQERAPRLFRHLFLSVLVCANLRAVTEDFTLFDLGNPICYLIIYLSFMYINKRRGGPMLAPA